MYFTVLHLIQTTFPPPYKFLQPDFHLITLCIMQFLETSGKIQFTIQRERDFIEISTNAHLGKHQSTFGQIELCDDTLFLVKYLDTAFLK